MSCLSCSPPEEFWTIDEAEEIVSCVADGQSLDDQQVTKLERLANAMAATSEDPRAAVERRARRLVTAERRRRDDGIRQRYPG